MIKLKGNDIKAIYLGVIQEYNRRKERPAKPYEVAKITETSLIDEVWSQYGVIPGTRIHTYLMTASESDILSLPNSYVFTEV